MTGYDDKVSVFYFGEWLKCYFFRNGKTIVDALDFSRVNHDAILATCEMFDRELKGQCQKIGKDYYILCCAALRQAAGAHKLVENGNGELLFLSRENNS